MKPPRPTALAAIRQELHYGTSPLVIEFATEEATHPLHPSKWWLEWSVNNPTTPWFVYFVGHVMIGWIFEERADFETLKQFVDCYETMNDPLWRDYCFEVDDYLEAQPKVNLVPPAPSSYAQYVQEESARRMQPFYDAFGLDPNK